MILYYESPGFAGVCAGVSNVYLGSGLDELKWPQVEWTYRESAGSSKGRRVPITNSPPPAVRRPTAFDAGNARQTVSITVARGGIYIVLALRLW